MTLRSVWPVIVTGTLTCGLMIGCAADTATPPGTGGTTAGSGGATTGTGGNATGSGGQVEPGTGGVAPGSGGATASSGGSGAGSGGATMTATGGAPSTGSGGAKGGAGGTMMTAGSGGLTATGGAGGGASMTATMPLDCGSMATVIENHGPPANRINYVIVGDGYAKAELTTTLISHVQKYMALRFSDVIGQPYARYRNFVNICVLQVESTPICGSSRFGCCGDDASRLANCNDGAVDAAIKQYLPASLPIDWKAVVLNGSSWWNSGGMLMYWSGGNTDAAGAAMHEGTHGFHQMADEYGGTGSDTHEWPEVNSTADKAMTAGKWDKWIGYDQVGATGVQTVTNTGFSTGSRYHDAGQYRPSDNSMMNSLFGSSAKNPKLNTSFNSVTREQMAIGMYRYVTPIDSTMPAPGAVSDPGALKVNVIDPAVINVDWTVDGVVKVNGGTTLDTSTLAPGSHTILARAYDNAGTDLVRYTDGTCWKAATGGDAYYCHRKNWLKSIQTVSWTVTIK